MFQSIAQSAGRKWQRLTHYSGTQRLSKFALVLLFGLDVFVLGMLFNGMEDVSSRINYPASAISSECEQMTEGFQKQKPNERVESIKRYVTVQSEEYLRSWATVPPQVRPLPVCEQLHAKLTAYIGDAALSELFHQQDQLREELSGTQTRIHELKHSYDSALLEKIAGQKREDSILPAEASKVKGQLEQFNATLQAQQNEAAQLQQALEQHAQVKAYADFINALPYPSAFVQERARYARSEFWYPFKTLTAQVAFLLPVLILALLWNAKVLRSQNGPQVLISSHLILVCLVPVFARVVYFFYELLPHQLLAELIVWLNQLNLGFIWRYVVIIGGILTCVIVIIIAQKTVFSPARLRTLRLRKVQCRECGEKLQSAEQACCEFCGTRQIEACAHCGQPRRMLAFFCNHCGGANAGAAAK